MVTDIFAVIADRTRRDILDTLRTGDKAVGELVEALSASQPTVSKHLKVLRDAGLVTTRAQGPKRFYTLRLEPLGEVGGWLADLATPTAPASAPAASPSVRAGAVPPAPAPSARVATPDGGPEAGAEAPVPDAGDHDDTEGPREMAPAAVVPASGAAKPDAGDSSRPAQIQRTVERTVERAAARATELMANLPKFGRRK